MPNLELMRLLWCAYSAAAVLTVLLAVLLADNGRLASLPWLAACIIAAAATGFGIRQHRPDNARVWVCIGAAVASWGVAAGLFPLVGLVVTTADYHVGDLLYLPGYLGIALTTVALVRALGPLRLAGLEAAIGALTLSTFLWSLVIEPNFDAHRGLVGGLGALFPLCDIALLMLVLRLLFSPSSKLPATRLLAAATVALVAADLAYFSPVFATGMAAGRVIAALYAVAYLLFGAAALHPSMRTIVQRTADEMSPRRLIALLACAPLTMPIAIEINQLVLGESDVEALALIGAGVIVLVMLRVTILLRDLDELRRRSEASEQKFRMVFDSAGHGISLGADGMMMETNVALHRMLGYSADELAAKHFSQLTYPDDVEVGNAASVAVMSGAETSRTFQKRYVRKDGTPIWTEVTLSRAADASFGIALIDDITERKQLEEELRQAQKMEAVGKLAGGIAHDFNNVMTAVSGCADLLLRELEPGDPRRSRVEVIAQSAARATDLTRQLLAFSRRQVLRLEPVDLSNVVAGMTAMLERLLPPNISVDYELAGGATVRIDRAQFEQVLLNLALNGRDAMPTGGRLSISVRTIDGDAELVVIDEGIGMDEETRVRIFEPFFTTKPSGTGLGLSTVDGIVAQSGGTLSVRSAPGRGTAITVRLPRIEASTAETRDVPGTPKPTAGRLLLIDDDDLVRRVTSEMLTRVGYDVVAAASGEAALALLEEDASFDVLVTDVAMSGMDGQALARHARALIPSLPVLFVSGYPAEVLAREQLVGADDEVLTKPFTPAELAERIEIVRVRTEIAA
jgi:PAS domain S-box-containing protein